MGIDAKDRGEVLIRTFIFLPAVYCAKTLRMKSENEGGGGTWGRISLIWGKKKVKRGGDRKMGPGRTARICSK